MKNRLLKASLLTFGLLFSMVSVAHATHYLQGNSAVDALEIRWGGSTTYSAQWTAAIATWNARGGVNIAPDTIWTWQDLTVSDVNRSYVSWNGLYTNLGILTDLAQLNTYYLQYDTTAQRQNTATHELGHALGLAHSLINNVMYSVQSSQTYLGAQDISDYDYLY